MTELPADLQQAVDDQAQARVAMNLQGFAKYLTPEAVDSLRASFQGIPPRVNRYDVAAAEPLGADFIVDIRYYARDDGFIVRSRWSRRGDPWMVVHAERLWAEGDKRPGFLSRLVASIAGRFASRPR